MTAINFPDSPSDGDTHTVGGVTYTYNNAETKWKTTINSNAFLPLTGGTVSGNLTTTGDVVLGGELQHSGDTDTKLHFDTDTIKLDTAGSERFRVGSAGQLGIGGATYGTDGQVLTSGGASVAPSWTTLSTTNLTRLTAVDTSSGAGSSGSTGVVYDSLPSTIRRITVLVYNVGGNGSSDHIRFLLRTGSGTDVTSGYSGFTSYLGPSNANHINSKTNSFPLWLTGDSERTSAIATFSNVDGNRWVYSAAGSFETNYNVVAGGYIDLGAQLTGIKMYLGNGNNFDSGRVNLFYEV